MTLTHLFRAQAVVFAIIAVFMFTQTEMMAGDMGWTMSKGIQTMSEHFSSHFLGFAIISWVMPSIAGDNLKKMGMIMGVYLNVLWVFMSVLHMVTELIPTGIMSLPVPMLILIPLFFWKSRADA